eukprot:SAG31_NODE_25557_length_459_cov_0.719444_2_plen_67_part_01
MQHARRTVRFAAAERGIPRMIWNRCHLHPQAQTWCAAPALNAASAGVAPVEALLRHAERTQDGRTAF